VASKPDRAIGIDSSKDNIDFCLSNYRAKKNMQFALVNKDLSQQSLSEALQTHCGGTR
jgi:hypothetical protein